MITCKDSVVEMEGDDKELCLDAAQILRALHFCFLSKYGEETADMLMEQALIDSRMPEETVRQHSEQLAKSWIK